MFEVSKDKSLVNVANSILKHFDIKTFHTTYEKLDEVLAKNKGKTIVLTLLDGLGDTILKEHAEESKFILKNKFDTITSVFPPTTVAATTSVLTGKYPCETGWLGWRGYFMDQDAIVDMFNSNITATSTVLTPTTWERYPVKHLKDYINEKYNEECAVNLMGHTMFEHGKYDAKVFFSKVDDAIKHGYKYIYAYYPDPDATLHGYGNYSKETSNIIKSINDNLEQLVKNNPDVLFISIADHGHIDIKLCSLDEHSDLYDTLATPYFCEARAGMINIKKGREKEFEKLFDKYYKEHFELYSKKEIVEKQIFGYSTNYCHDYDKILGDYLLVSKDEYTLFFENYDWSGMLSTHAGGTEREGLINISVYNNL